MYSKQLIQELKARQRKKPKPPTPSSSEEESEEIPSPTEHLTEFGEPPTPARRHLAATLAINLQDLDKELAKLERLFEFWRASLDRADTAEDLEALNELLGPGMHTLREKCTKIRKINQELLREGMRDTINTYLATCNHYDRLRDSVVTRRMASLR